MTYDIYKRLEERIINWGLSNEDIFAVYIVGSRARKDKPYDELSDLDVVVFSTNPGYYLQTDEWLLNIDKVWTSFLFRTAGGDPEKLIVFDQGAQVDFVFHHIIDLEHIIQSGQIPLVFQRGARLLLDKRGDGHLLIHTETYAPESKPITEGAFLQVVNMFGFACLYVAKLILRNDMWSVNHRDKDCKELLLQMVEWHAKAIHGAAYDTWHAGKFIHDWADPDVIAELKHTFGGYDQINSWKALNVSFELFSRLSSEVATSYKFTYPEPLFTNIRTWLAEQQLDILSKLTAGKREL